LRTAAHSGRDLRAELGRRERSTACITVIMKTSERIATSEPAHAHIDDRAKSTTYG
jgi:hypothetical protein